MKFFCLIFSVYILSLCAIPCSDSVCPEGKYKQEAFGHKSKDADNKDCHTCSPFCVCSCCQGNTILTVKSTVCKPDIKAEKVYIVYKEASHKDISYSIWQPPKINC